MGTRSWKVIFWAGLTLTAAWLLLLVTLGFLMLYSGAFDGGIYHAPAERLVRLLVLVSPLGATAVAVRAFFLRQDRPKLAGLALIFLPPVTTAIMFAGQGLDNHLRAQRIIAEGIRRSHSSVTFVCGEDDGASSRQGLKISTIWQPTKRRNWVVAWNGKPPVPVEQFEAHTGFIGGSLGMAWRDNRGNPISAQVSFSDVIGNYGPTKMFVSLAEATPADLQRKIDRNDYRRFYCVPDPASYHVDGESP